MDADKFAPPPAPWSESLARDIAPPGGSRPPEDEENRLGTSFDRVSQGDLSVRRLPDMKRRHDELSDVARDFDAMVERL